ncbi:acyl-CoA thioesterase [Elasticomyces elasticus]|nr:acyl-CoA thioesterase [Elasticomyces elasticus]KAK4911655.1 acyl-CoA thioesterase [Elasticomyces elasticus]KAK5748930.1 acyl-CoA thioesterase [Elasticomyces elasticus]
MATVYCTSDLNLTDPTSYHPVGAGSRALRAEVQTTSRASAHMTVTHTLRTPIRPTLLKLDRSLSNNPASTISPWTGQPLVSGRSIVTMSSYPTLIKPPKEPTGKSAIEDVLELTHLEDINPNLFTNTRPLWHPPGARGIYGGAVIAQCLAAAQRTVQPSFTVHSMHCYFVLNGNADIPIIYHVERVREGRSFATRTVQARQRGAPIFTTTLSFMREGSGGKKLVEHAHHMPDVPFPSDEQPGEDLLRGANSPFVSQRIDILNNDSSRPYEKRTRQWIKAKGRISDDGGHQAHLSALAYMSDSYFIGTISRVHKLWRYSASPASANKKEGGGKLGITPETVEKLKKLDDATLRRMEGMDEDIIAELRNVDVKDGEVVWKLGMERPEIGMMVSLDHTIYFHSPKDFRADEWMFTECDSPWSGDGRGLVHQRMYTKDGTLIATCVQEGLVRLKQDAPKL